MFRLPPPPRFTLPPPPPLMLSSDTKYLVQWTCSSVRQHQPIVNLRLILISCISFFMISLMFTILFMLIQSYRRRKSLLYNYESKLSSLAAATEIMASNNLSMISSRSYETISIEHTSGYIYSTDTSVTTYATDSHDNVCCHCHQAYEYSNNSLSMSPPLYYQAFDIISS